MNTELLKSKKFRTAVLSAVASVLAFGVAKFGWDLDVDEIMLLLGAILTPFLIYIGAEGASEMQAKKVVEENKAREELTNLVLNKAIAVTEEKTDETN